MRGVSPARHPLILILIVGTGECAGLAPSRADTRAAPAPVILAGDPQCVRGSSYTVSGTGFGQKESAAPIRFDDFESGAVDAQLKGWAFSTSQRRNPAYSDAYTRPNSTRSARCDFDGGQYLSSFGFRSAEALSEIYIDAWYLYDPADPPSRNHKLFRLYADQDAGMPNLYLNVYCDPNGSAHLSQDGLNNIARESNVDQWISWTWSAAHRRWVHIQGYFKESSTPLAEDGACRIWIDCVQLMNNGTFQTRDDRKPTMWHSVWFGNYLSHEEGGDCAASPGASFTYWDDVYVDRTQAHVELGDADAYERCSRREIQVPVRWSDAEITIRVNGGGFERNTDLYLFVVNQAGAVSSGFGPLPLGGGDGDAKDRRGTEEP